MIFLCLPHEFLHLSPHWELSVCSCLLGKGFLWRADCKVCLCLLLMERLQICDCKTSCKAFLMLPPNLLAWIIFLLQSVSRWKSHHNHAGYAGPTQTAEATTLWRHATAGTALTGQHLPRAGLGRGIMQSKAVATPWSSCYHPCPCAALSPQMKCSHLVLPWKEQNFFSTEQKDEFTPKYGDTAEIQAANSHVSCVPLGTLKEYCSQRKVLVTPWCFSLLAQNFLQYQLPVLCYLAVLLLLFWPCSWPSCVLLQGTFISRVEWGHKVLWQQ